MRKFLVVLSGGQDSTTCLYWAKAQCDEVHALTFDYGQRHVREIAAADIVAKMAGVKSHTHMRVPKLAGKSPLTNPDIPVGHYEKPSDMPGGIEPTFVPGRNIIFLALAANVASALGCCAIVTGVGQEDSGGYPDCRAGFIGRMEQAIQLGLAESIQIMTPLMALTKRGTVELARGLPGCMEALAYSHTCYDGQYPPNPKNHASILRARGFHEAHIGDPLIMRAKNEGLLPADYPDDGYVVKE